MTGQHRIGNTVFEALSQLLSSNQSALLKWFPPLVVLLGEHFLLRYHYGLPSSLQRMLFKPSESAKTDMSMWSVYYLIYPAISYFVHFLVLPGLVLIGSVWLYRHHGFNGLFGEQLDLPVIGSVLLWLLLIDVISYGVHVLMHKVPYFWRYHRLHHAAREMNITTGIRVSIAEKVLGILAQFGIATMILGLPRPEVLFWVFAIRAVVDLLQHSDLPWGYGVFGKLIASPRFHRMHHSVHRPDFDANYGDILSFWDYLFGTVAPRYRADRKIADQVQLGLPEKSDLPMLNNWKAAWLDGFVPTDIFEYWQARKAKAAVSKEAA